eukprot:g10510.t1
MQTEFLRYSTPIADFVHEFIKGPGAGPTIEFQIEFYGLAIMSAVVVSVWWKVLYQGEIERKKRRANAKGRPRVGRTTAAGAGGQMGGGEGKAGRKNRATAPVWKVPPEGIPVVRPGDPETETEVPLIDAEEEGKQTQ